MRALLAGCIACACASEATPLPAGELQLRIDTADVRPTGRLVGWNLGRGTLYATAGDAIHPQWRTPERTAAFARLAALRNPDDAPPYVRFSGLQIDGALGQD